MTMRSLIDKLKDQPTTVDERRAEQKQEWLQALEQLFTDIEGWVKPAVDEGVLRTSRSSIGVVEQDLGQYQAQMLEIRARGLTIRFEPIGLRVVGLVGAGGHRLIGLHGAEQPTETAPAPTPKPPASKPTQTAPRRRLRCRNRRRIRPGRMASPARFTTA